MSGSGISWAICKSAPRSRQITTPATLHSVFTGRMPSCHPTNSIKALKASANWQHKISRSLTFKSMYKHFKSMYKHGNALKPIYIQASYSLHHSQQINILCTRYPINRWRTVVSATWKYDDPRLNGSHEGAHELPCVICFVVWPTTRILNYM